MKHTILSTDVTVFRYANDRLEVLLTKAANPEYKGMQCLIGGLVDYSETIDYSAKRYINTFVDYSWKIYLEQVYTFGELYRDPSGRVVAVAYMALLDTESIKKIKGTQKYPVPEWFPADRLPSLAYDHNIIIAKSLERLRGKLEYTNIIANLLPNKFTLTQFQSCYENITGKKLDKRNLRKKLLSLNILKQTQERTSGLKQRPAALYTFKSKKLKNISLI